MAAAPTLLLLLGLPPAVPDPVAAHAIVLESVPAPDAVLARAPAEVTLRFNSKIEKRLTRVTLTGGGSTPRPVAVAASGPDEARDPDRIVIPLRPLAPGRYVIRYKVLSADGHVTEGVLRFTVTGSQ